MPVTIKNIILLFAGTLLCFQEVHSQDWELGFQGGGSGYMGELNQANPFAYNDWTLGILVRKNLSRDWAVRLNVLRAGARGDASKSTNEFIQSQKLYFKAPIFEASLVGEFNFFKFEPSYTDIAYTPYVFAGIGGFHFQPKNSNFEGDLVNLHDYYTEDVNYSRWAVQIPFGVGFRYNLRGPFTLGLELGYRIAFTDYLDDISADYVDVDAHQFEVEGGRAQRAYFIDPSQQMRVGMQRGDGRKKDSYMLASITVTYAIFRAGCPVYIKKN